MQHQALIKFAETSVILALTVKMLAIKHNYLIASSTASIAIDMLKLPFSVQGVKKFVYSYLEYKDQTEKRAQLEIKNDSKDCEVSSSQKKHYNLSRSLQLCGG